jgi:anti-sigma regulatory factor (Ser/Thr protein kinase)
MNDFAQLQLTPGLDDLAEIRRFVEQIALKGGGEAKPVGQMLIAMNEAVTNVILHGYGERSGPMEIKVRFDQKDLVIVIRDRAPAFDPTQVTEPDVELPLAERQPGGMGIHMMRAFVDELRYRRIGNQNELTLVKKQVRIKPYQD